MDQGIRILPASQLYPRPVQTFSTLFWKHIFKSGVEEPILSSYPHPQPLSTAAIPSCHPTHRKEAGGDKNEPCGWAGAQPHPAIPKHLF